MYIKKFLLLLSILYLTTLSSSIEARSRHRGDYTGAIVAGSILGMLAAATDDYPYYYYRPDYHYYSYEELARDLAQEVRELKRENRRLRRECRSDRLYRRRR